jgi:hypothetical protein
LRPAELLRFVVASLKQLLSPQGPAYLQFLGRVLTRHPAMLREALALAAKGYHLRKITEQLTAVENFKQYLALAMTHLQAERACGTREGQTRLNAVVREVVAHIQREYAAIHRDFRHEVDDALHTFVQALAPSLQACPLPMPRHFASALRVLVSPRDPATHP